ncbi:MAG: AmmeMemoRadiSam system radical SAM enzyme [Coriobacteriales bacterium]|nr:AmmeMemoRadiSam system radical SAM enzyme [Coriobacteriales bacterium]
MAEYVECTTCPRGCKLVPGMLGACHARGNVDGVVVPTGYGRVTSLAVDPVEKKPLARWKPGSTVLSLGSYGCNLRCPWCQNHSISQVGENGVGWRLVSPEELMKLAVRLNAEDSRMVGVAYTYNEPLVSWEFVRDCGLLMHEVGLSNVLVSAGCVSSAVVQEIAPLIDAANIDLKSFSSETYRTIGGDLATVQETIRLLAATSSCHLEVTTLVVPDVNDSVDEMRELAAWLASVDPDITLHVSRFFPNWRMRDRGPTPVSRVYGLAETARKYLAHVYTGNC